MVLRASAASTRAGSAFGWAGLPSAGLVGSFLPEPPLLKRVPAIIIVTKTTATTTTHRVCFIDHSVEWMNQANRSRRGRDLFAEKGYFPFLPLPEPCPFCSLSCFSSSSSFLPLCLPS